MKALFGLNKREVKDLLKSKGINPTSQRVEMAFCLLSKPRHLCADEIRGLLNKEYEQVSQATVYNNLKLFAEKGVVRELIVSSDRIYYDSNTTQHHHFIDTITGEIEDIPENDVKVMNLDLDVNISEINVIVKGQRNRVLTT